uniref:Uncharacterized protein n=1 Tax=Palpitomonas bilix TaxID=652834 RepID=A0A7S3G9H2_9EUKA
MGDMLLSEKQRKGRAVPSTVVTLHSHGLCAVGWTDGLLTLIDTAAGRVHSQWEAVEGPILSITVLPDHCDILLVFSSKMLWIWDIRMPEPRGVVGFSWDSAASSTLTHANRGCVITFSDVQQVTHICFIDVVGIHTILPRLPALSSSLKGDACPLPLPGDDGGGEGPAHSHIRPFVHVRPLLAKSSRSSPSLLTSACLPLSKLLAFGTSDGHLQVYA